MTRCGKLMFTLHGLVLLGTVRAGLIASRAGVWDLALTLYAITAVALMSLLREISRAHLHEQTPTYLNRLRARRTVRRLRPEQCTCDAWWESLGEAHDATCYRAAPRRSDYLATEDE